jgi:SAM-dependent methyltransferase
MRDRRDMTSAKAIPADPGNASPRQDEINRAVYNSPGVYRHYLSKLLTPAEVACLFKYQTHVAQRDVLDIGVGAGRTARYLAPLARRYEAVDYSSVMVSYMKQTMPEVSVRQANFRDLTMFDDESFDFVLATDNVIDALPHEDRLRALREAHRVLRRGGVLAFSSHNIHFKKAFGGPHLNWSFNPVRLAANCVNYVLSRWNYHRVAPLRTTTSEYALLNDPGHRYACLHYYAARSTVCSQLASAEFQLIEAFDAGGIVVPGTKDDSENPSLLYVAQRTEV